MVMGKVLGLLILILAYFAWFVFGPWYDHLSLQGIVFTTLVVSSLIRHGWSGTLRSLWIIFPFVLTLIFFGIIFDWFQLMGRSDWLNDSLVKAVVFPNSFLVTKLCLESISFRDLIALPVSQKTRRSMIILKAVMGKCTPLLFRFRFFMSLSPHFHNQRWPQFWRLCAVVMALYISIYRQAEQTRDLYDHRQTFLREKP